MSKTKQGGHLLQSVTSLTSSISLPPSFPPSLPPSPSPHCSTLLHASFVLVPILGVSWVLGFLVVGEGIYATIVEWLFFFFTTLQGAAIFITHCVLNREVCSCPPMSPCLPTPLSLQVRTAFLKAIGCRKLAKKQKTMMSHSRQISRVGSTVSSRSTNLFRKIMSRREKHSFARSESSFMVSENGSSGCVLLMAFLPSLPLSVHSISGWRLH